MKILTTRTLATLSIALSLFLTACGDAFTTQEVSQSQTSSPNSQNTSNGNIQVFFAKQGVDTGGPENNLIAAINQASTTIDMAIYELSLTNVTESLISAHQRGVSVRVLTDSDHLNWERFLDLATAGITVRGDQRSALMHNKFTVIDKKEVWTGSMNLTFTGAYRNRENLIRLNNAQAAINYSEEFAQLWVGTHNQANTATNFFSIRSSSNAIPVDIHFSPDDNFRSTRLIPLLRDAKQSVHLLAFAFTSQSIADELVALEQHGIDVKVVVDSSQSGQSSSQYDDLLAQKLDIKRDGESFKLHHKVIIIDGRIVITGSYNFSENAESRNDENSVVIESTEVAGIFEREFADIYSQGVARRALRTLVGDGF